MLSLPVEIRLPIIHHIQDSIPTPLFEDYPLGSIRAIQEFYAVLIALSLYHREWTAIAQSELFRNLYIRDEEKLKSLLDLLHGSEESREYMKHSRSALLGGNRYWGYPRGCRDDLDKLADYCPDLEQMSCYCMDLKLAECQRFQKLRKLNLSSSDILPAPATSHLDTLALSITSLSLDDACDVPSPLDPASLPFVRSLTADFQHYLLLYDDIFPLLPQLTSLTILNVCSDTIAQWVTLSTSLKILALSLHAIGDLNLDTQGIVRERIEELRIVIDRSWPSHGPLSAIVNGSRVLRKVIADGSKSSIYGESVNVTMNTLLPVCQKAKVELWKENFKAGNGKVDLDSE